jgi:DNA-binding LytR/AlgR family response regulator
LNPDIFFKVSRNYIININQVDRIRPTLKRNKLIQLKAPYQNVQIEVGMESVKALKGKLL